MESPDGAPPPALPAHLTLDEAVRIFRERGFDLLLADAATAQARGDLTAARAFPNPLISAGGGHSFTYDPSRCAGCSASLVTAGVSDQGLLADLFVGKRRLRIDVAREALAAAERSRSDAERTLLALLKQQYTATVLARELRAFAEETAGTLAKTATLVAARQRAGDASEADLARAETAKLEAEQAVDAATQQLETARAQLAYLLAVRGTPPVFEVDDTLPPAVAPGAFGAANPDSLVELAEANRPDLAAADAQLRSADASLSLARRERIPDVALVAGYQRQGTGQVAIQPPTATLGVTLPLPVLYRNQGEIQRAEAQLSAQRVARDKVESQVGTDVRTAWTAFTTARSRLERSQGRLLARARQARDLVDYQYQKGAVSLFERLDAERTFVAVQVEYLQTMADFWTARYQLEAAVGSETPS